MTIEQIVDIPAISVPGEGRRLVLDVPPEVPAGRTVIAFTPEAPASGEAEEAEMDETEYLSRSPANKKQLDEAIDDIRNGRNLITFATLEDAIRCVKARNRAKK